MEERWWLRLIGVTGKELQIARHRARPLAVATGVSGHAGASSPASRLVGQELNANEARNNEESDEEGKTEGIWRALLARASRS